jgi:predicted  nucleic acid-binding Zn-ribbon protein
MQQQEEVYQPEGEKIQEKPSWWTTAQELFRESTWITIAWEWLQKLLGRAVDLVLWVTMVYSGYQLIPGAPQASPGINSFMFIAQFIALDVGGLGLNQLGQQAGLPRSAFSRVVAYILIGITLVTITYAGIHHAFEATVTVNGKAQIENLIPENVNRAVEVILVIARAIMTVFYGQAIKALSTIDHAMRDRLDTLESENPELREQVDTLREQVSSVQGRLSSVQHQLDASREQVSTLEHQLDTKQHQLDTLQQELETGQGDTVGLRRELHAAIAKIEMLQAQLDTKHLELAGLRATLEEGQDWQTGRIQALLDAEQQRAAHLQQLLVEEQNATVVLRREKNAAVIEADQLRSQVDAQKQEVHRVHALLQSEQQKVSNLTAQLSSVQSQVSSLRVQLDSAASTKQAHKVDAGHSNVVQLDASRSRKTGQEVAEQVRALLKKNPGLSGRAIANELSISPTTAAKWKEFYEKGEQGYASN